MQQFDLNKFLADTMPVKDDAPLCAPGPVPKVKRRKMMIPECRSMDPSRVTRDGMGCSTKCLRARLTCQSRMQKAWPNWPGAMEQMIQGSFVGCVGITRLLQPNASENWIMYRSDTIPLLSLPGIVKNSLSDQSKRSLRNSVAESQAQGRVM